MFAPLAKAPAPQNAFGVSAPQAQKRPRDGLRLPGGSSEAQAGFSSNAAKLEIGRTDDSREREAETIAGQMMRTPAAPEPRDAGPQIEAPLAGPRFPIEGNLGVPTTVADVLRSPGSPLGSTERRYFESRLHRDFSNVRIHADAAAIGSAIDVRARAYTVGQHIVFGETGALSDRRLLAHELVHTIQQRSGGLVLLRQPAPGAQPQTPDPQAAKIAELKAELVASFGLSAVTDSPDAKWTVPHLEKMKRSLARVPAAELGAIRGVELRRVKVTSEFSATAGGLFKSQISAATGDREDRIEISDDGLDDDKDFDEGGAKETFGGEEVKGAPSEGVLAHEIGHAVETVHRRTAEAKRVKADLANAAAANSLTQVIADYRTAIAAPIDFPAGGIGSEKKYKNALKGAQIKLRGVTNAIDRLPTAPTLAQSKKGATAVRKVVVAAEKAMAARDQAKKALPADSPFVMAAEEQAQDSWLAAATAVVDALEARATAQEEFQKHDDPSDTQIHIKVSSGSKVRMTRRLAEFVAIIELNKIDIKGAGFSGHVTSNWPNNPAEAYAELYSFSLIAPVGLQRFDPKGAVAKYFASPVGPKGDQPAKVRDWIAKHQ